MDRIKWKNGSLLSERILVKHDELVYGYINASRRINKYGRIDRFQVDTRLLSTGVFSILTLEGYTGNGEYFSIKAENDQNVYLALNRKELGLHNVYLYIEDTSIQNAEAMLNRRSYRLTTNLKEVGYQFLKLAEVLVEAEVVKLGDFCSSIGSCDVCTLQPILNDFYTNIRFVSSKMDLFLGSPVVWYRMRQALFNVALRLKDIETCAESVHPCALFEDLRMLLCCCLDDAPVMDLVLEMPSYDAEAPIESFRTLFKLLDQINMVPTQKSYIKFEYVGDLFIIRNIPEQVRTVANYWLVVNKPNRGLCEDLSSGSRRLRLSSIERESLCRALSIQGVKLLEVPNAKIAEHLLEQSTRTYQLMPCSELEYIRKDGSIAFPVTEVNKEYDYYLYYE